MAENKVKFHALERLDLVDVDAVQNNVYEYIAKAFGNLIGDANGLVQLPVEANIVIDSADEEIDFPDFVFVEAVDDPDYADSLENRIVAFDAGFNSNGTCSYDTALANVQSYYTTNNSLPTGPREAGFDTANNNLFPYIWVKKVEVDTEQNNRRFWSVSNNNEYTQAVVTRRKFAVNFELSYTRPDSGSTVWTKIARIKKWGQSGGTVNLPAPATSLEYYTLADSLYFSDGDYTLDTHSGSRFSSQLNNGGGLLTTLQTIRKQIADIRGDGELDSGIPNISTDSNFYARPYYSLDGLYFETIDIRNRIRQRKRGQFVSTLLIDPGNDSHTINTISYFNSNRDYVLETNGVAFDYALMYQHNSGIFPLDFSSANFGTDLASSQNWIASSSILTIRFDDYEGYGAIVNAHIVATETATGDGTATENYIVDPSGYQFRPMGAYSYTRSQVSGAFNDILKVTADTRRNSSGTTTAFTGVKIALYGLDNIIGSTNFLANGNKLRISVKVDFELIEA